MPDQIGLRGMTARVEAVWILKIHVALTLVCAMTGNSGVPFDVEIPDPVRTVSGWPVDVTRAVPTIH
jgi:hypothetical protein